MNNKLAEYIKDVPPDPETHETFLIGFDKNDKIIFFKSYTYLEEIEKVHEDSEWVNDNCDYWEFGAANEFKIFHEGRLHDIIINHP